MCWFCDKRPKREGLTTCLNCDPLVNVKPKRRQRVNPFEHAEVVVRWKNVVIAQVHNPNFDSCSNGAAHSIRRIDVNLDRLGASVKTSRGSKRVINLDEYQPNMSGDQVKAYKKVLRQLGAL